MPTRRQKEIELGQTLMARGAFDKKAFLENFSALTQTEAALILGCRPRDVQSILKPDFYLKNRPRYIMESVRAKQAEFVKQTQKILNGK